MLGLVTFLGLLALVDLQRVKMSLGLLSVFAVAFAMAVGSLWEMFEFFMDRTFGLNMMKSGLNDTMSDLIVNCLGALAAVALAHVYVARRATRASWLNLILERMPRRRSRRSACADRTGGTS